MNEELNIKTLVGKILTRVWEENDELHFQTKEGDHFKLYHQQDCCENVYIESTAGDLSDLVGPRSPILVAEESTSETDPEDYKRDGTLDSCTWTFYKFATRKGYVDIRWIGESNGYYSESVDFVKVN